MNSPHRIPGLDRRRDHQPTPLGIAPMRRPNSSGVSVLVRRTMILEQLRVLARVDQDQLVPNGTLKDRMQHRRDTCAPTEEIGLPQWPWSPTPGPTMARSCPSTGCRRMARSAGRDTTGTPPRVADLEVFAGEPAVLDISLERNVTEGTIPPPPLPDPPALRAARARSAARRDGSFPADRRLPSGPSYTPVNEGVPLFSRRNA